LPRLTGAAQQANAYAATGGKRRRRLRSGSYMVRQGLLHYARGKAEAAA